MIGKCWDATSPAIPESGGLESESESGASEFESRPSRTRVKSELGQTGLKSDSSPRTRVNPVLILCFMLTLCFVHNNVNGFVSATVLILYRFMHVWFFIVVLVSHVVTLVHVSSV
jgi:hypothetical protein